MLISDHIIFFLQIPLSGKMMIVLEHVFPDMGSPYNKTVMKNWN